MKKHINFVILTFVIIILAGCTQKFVDNYVCSDGTTASTPSECESAEEPIEGAVECNFAEDCPGGYCDVDPDNPANNKCVYPEPI